MEATVLVEQRGPVATVTINRPALLNAFDAATILRLRDAFQQLGADQAVRVVVLTGAGTAFCAGGDASWMRSSMQMSREENRADAEVLAAMFEAAWQLPKPLIGRVNGVAIGGGAGLVACCDLAVAVDNARFGFGEVKLGLVPSVITAYVLPKIGLSHARALFVSGERFSAERAFEIGLVHAVTPEEELDTLVANLVERVLSSGPQAVAVTKQVIDRVWAAERAETQRFLIETIASVRTGAEAQEGLSAFLEKRRPSWRNEQAL